MKVNKKILKVIGLTLMLILVQSCYKIKDKSQLIYGNIICVDTNNVGMSNIKYRVYEKEFKYSNPKTFLEGETDQNGKSYFEFNPPSNSKWDYYLQMNLASFPTNYSVTFERGHSNMLLFGSSEPNKLDINDVDSYGMNDLIIRFTPK